MENNDLAELLNGASAGEVDRIHRLLNEWSVGPEDSYPVQLALLTRAQWRMAASVPRSLDDSRKWLELHLAEYRKEIATLVDHFSDVTGERAKELTFIVANHADAMQQAAATMRHQLQETENVAGQIRGQMESGDKEWNRAKSEFSEERQKFANVCKELDERLDWRNVLWFGFGLLGVLGIGIAIGRIMAH